jgi:hypothetical protein
MCGIHYIYCTLKLKMTNTSGEYIKSGNYKLMYSMYKCSCVGQTSCNLKLRYEEHVRYIRNNNPQLIYAAHVLNNVHKYGPYEQLTVPTEASKCPSLNSFEQCYIQIQLYSYNNKLVHEQ